MIEIYCQSQSHARPGKTHVRRCTVAAFYRDAAADGGWEEVAPPTRKQRTQAPELPREEDENELEYLLRTAVPSDKPAAGHWVVPDAVSAADYESAGRRRFSFMCELCRFTVEARGENLFPVLDRLDAAGVPELSLQGLAATI